MKKWYLPSSFLTFFIVLFLSSFLKHKLEFEVRQKPQFKFEKATIEGDDEEEEDERENPEKRLEYEYYMLANPSTGKIPEGIRLKEFRFQKELERQNLLNLPTQSFGANSVQTPTFESRGPYHIGGRTRAIGIDVANEEIILAGGVSGGIWRTTNGGESWARTSSVTQLPAVSALVQDQRSGQTDTWFYAAGELIGNSASASGAFYLGDGIFKSTDNGASWNVIPSTTQGSNTTLGDFGLINAIVIDNSNASEREMYAASLSKIYRTTDDFQTFDVVLGANNTGISYTDLAISSTGVLVATIANDNDNGPNAQTGVYLSSDGTSWVKINPPSGLPSNHGRIEVAFDANNEDVFYILGTSFLLKYSINAGQWLTLTPNLNVSSDPGQGHNGQGGYNLILGVHPDNSNVVFAGGTNLLRSTDAFQTSVNRVNIGGYLEDNNPNNFPQYSNHHSDQHALAFYPSDPNKMLSGNDGGIQRTIDNLASGGNSPVKWESLNNGYLTSQVYAVDSYKFNRGEALTLAGLQDNGSVGSQTFAADEKWVSLLGGDGSYNAATYNSLYVSAQEGQLRRFVLDESTQTYDYVGDISPSFDEDDFLFINPFIYDPVKQDRMYVGAQGRVFYTNDIREEPSEIDWTNLNMSQALGSDFVTALSASIEPEGMLYFGTRAGNLMKISDITSTEVEDITPDNFPEGSITSVSVDPRDANNVYVTFGNYGIVSIWMSNDGGSSWESISGNLEENPDGSGSGPSIRYFEILPNGTDASLYFVGTSLGLYMTGQLDGDNTVWVKEAEETVGSSIVTMVKAKPIDGQVLVATHGNGVFQANYDISFLPNINYSIDKSTQIATLRGPVSYITGGGFAYQWLKNGEEIEGAQDANYVTESSGSYQLKVSDEFGGELLSNTINIGLDKVGPSLVSLKRLTPLEEEIEAEEVTFQLIFDQPTFDVKTTSFKLNGDATGIVSSVTQVADNTTFNVMVTGIEGLGTLNLDVADDSGIVDEFGNEFTGTISLEESYTLIDVTAPEILSILRSAPTLATTNLPSVTFDVLFDEDVENVDASDFALSATSITANDISVEKVNAQKYAVTVTGYEEDGIIDLDISASNNIEDVSGNAFEGFVLSEQTFMISADVSPKATITRAFPTVEEINRTEVTFLVSFSGDVQNLDVDDFTLSSNSVDATISEVTQNSASLYRVEITDIGGEGLIDLNFAESLSVNTSDGNLFTGIIDSEQTYTFKTTAGATATILRHNPAQEEIDQTTAIFEVTFSTNVQNVDLSDFKMADNSVSATIQARQSVSGSVYRIQIVNIQESGLVDLDISSDNNIVGSDNNFFSGVITQEQTYTANIVVTSIDNPQDIEGAFIILKNPSEGGFTLKVGHDFPSGFKWAVIDNGGAQVLENEKPSAFIGDEIKLNLSSFSDGVFLLRIDTGKATTTLKLLKREQ